jgi:hypothetical protein
MEVDKTKGGISFTPVSRIGFLQAPKANTKSNTESVKNVFILNDLAY